MQLGPKWDITEKEMKKKSDENKPNWDKTETNLRKLRQNCNKLQKNRRHNCSFWIWASGSLLTEVNWRKASMTRKCAYLVKNNKARNAYIRIWGNIACVQNKLNDVIKFMRHRNSTNTNILLRWLILATKFIAKKKRKGGVNYLQRTWRAM